MRYTITDLGQDILAAIDAGARDVYDINVHVWSARQSRGEAATEPHELNREINALRHKGQLIRPTLSPRDAHRAAYERGVDVTR